MRNRAAKLRQLRNSTRLRALRCACPNPRRECTPTHGHPALHTEMQWRKSSSHPDDRGSRAKESVRSARCTAQTPIRDSGRSRDCRQTIPRSAEFRDADSCRASQRSSRSSAFPGPAECPAGASPSPACPCAAIRAQRRIPVVVDQRGARSLNRDAGFGSRHKRHLALRLALGAARELIAIRGSSERFVRGVGCPTT